MGEIRMFAGNYAPRGWVFCEGQEMDIRRNEALYSILGTFYGGDGTKTFKLPDLRGKLPMHPGGAGSVTSTSHPGTAEAGQKVAKSTGGKSDPSTQSTVRINFIICIEGIYPSRN